MLYCLLQNVRDLSRSSVELDTKGKAVRARIAQLEDCIRETKVMFVKYRKAEYVQRIVSIEFCYSKRAEPQQRQIAS